ncbi:hypothetical protein Q4574_01715 [Aliiglaciecola sp. 3_MG-2023]|uniref:hypothetical protein n=1 Tax=Aliiglaciecola sp. 3_MG-2023 TaxID=3062644 RepID=UPI0026E2EC1E|nr:hypothetical protein [Aliiglaciecola sp. 3_MG-2023]MDO6691976.1 hypothetical protein [Aliiglaciecola sp. 3_MG-2023]
MSVFKKLKLACILVIGLVNVSTSLNAHVLNETTAQVVLRDGQVEVKLLTDIDHLISNLQSEQAWLLGDIDAVMPENLNASQQEAFIADALKQKMNLTINGVVIGFETATLESGAFDTDHLGTDDLERDSFQNKSKHSNSRNHGREIVFQARHSIAQVSELSISFHKILGAVHTNFVKPQYKLLSAGETAHIEF